MRPHIYNATFIVYNIVYYVTCHLKAIWGHPFIMPHSLFTMLVYYVTCHLKAIWGHTFKMPHALFTTVVYYVTCHLKVIWDHTFKMSHSLFTLMIITCHLKKTYQKPPIYNATLQIAPNSTFPVICHFFNANKGRLLYCVYSFNIL